MNGFCYPPVQHPRRRNYSWCSPTVQHREGQFATDLESNPHTEINFRKSRALLVKKYEIIFKGEYSYNIAMRGRISVEKRFQS